MSHESPRSSEPPESPQSPPPRASTGPPRIRLGRLARTWWPVVMLGLTTIGAYGVAFYSFGVLIGPIVADTGWSLTQVAGAFSVGALGAGGVALVSGRVLDRTGSRPVLWGGLITGLVMFLLASYARTSLEFLVAWGIGAAAVGGGLFYNVTMPVAARLFPERRATAFSVLTLIGAFASPIFFPAASAMLDAWGWRVTLRVLAGVMTVLVLPAALTVAAPSGVAQARESHERRTGLVEALRSIPVAGTIATFAMVGMASTAVIVHQVPAVQAAGLSLAAASGLAGARGLLQIPGRLVLTVLTRWWGTSGALALSYVVAAIGAWALFAAGPFALVLVFVVASGLSLGVILPLQGMFAAEVYPGEHLGTISGVQQVAGSVAGAAGPWLTSLAVDETGSYRLALGVVGGLQLAALVSILALDRARRRGNATMQSSV